MCHWFSCVASVLLIVEFVEDILNLKPAIVALFPTLVQWFWIEVTNCRNKSDFQRPAHDFKWQNYSHWWEIAKKEALKYQPSIILRGDATRAHQMQVGATTKLASLLLGTEQIFSPISCSSMMTIISFSLSSTGKNMGYYFVHLW